MKNGEKEAKIRNFYQKYRKIISISSREVVFTFFKKIIKIDVGK